MVNFSSQGWDAFQGMQKGSIPSSRMIIDEQASVENSSKKVEHASPRTRHIQVMAEAAKALVISMFSEIPEDEKTQIYAQILSAGRLAIRDAVRTGDPEAVERSWQAAIADESKKLRQDLECGQ